MKENTPEAYFNNTNEQQEINEGYDLQSCLKNTTEELISGLPRHHWGISLSTPSHYEISPTTIQEYQDRIDSQGVNKSHTLPKDEMILSSVYEISPCDDSISSYDSETFVDHETDHEHGSSFHNSDFPYDRESNFDKSQRKPYTLTHIDGCSKASCYEVAYSTVDDLICRNNRELNKNHSQNKMENTNKISFLRPLTENLIQADKYNYEDFPVDAFGLEVESDYLTTEDLEGFRYMNSVNISDNNDNNDNDSEDEETSL